MRLNVVLLVGGLTVIPGVAPTQGLPPDSLQTTVQLPALIEMALARNPAIRAAEQRYRALRAVPRQVSTLPDPILGYTRWARSVETRVGPQENIFVLSQHVPFPGKLGLMGKMAGQEAEAAREHTEATRRDIVFQVKSAYADLYRVDRSLEILNTYQALLRDFSRVAATKYATGQGIQAQVLKADVEISSIETRKLEFQRMRTSVVARLNALLDRPAATPIGPAAQLDTGRLPLNEEQLLNLALSRRQELRANQAMIAKADFGVRLAHKAYWPDFNLQATYVTIPQVNSTFADAGKDAFSFMVGLNLPIWLGKRRAAVEQATENLAAQESQYENLRNQIQAEIRDLIFQIETLRQTLDLYEHGLLIQAESSLESALSAYKTGTLDFLNLLDAERMLLQIRLAYIGDLALHFKQQAALERAAGGRLAE